MSHTLSIVRRFENSTPSKSIKYRAIKSLQIIKLPVLFIVDIDRCSLQPEAAAVVQAGFDRLSREV